MDILGNSSKNMKMFHFDEENENNVMTKSTLRNRKPPGYYLEKPIKSLKSGSISSSTKFSEKIEEDLQSKQKKKFKKDSKSKETKKSKNLNKL